MSKKLMTVAPLKAASIEQMFENWPVCWSDTECITTDGVRASDTLDYDFPSDAKADAEWVAVALGDGYSASIVPETDDAKPFLRFGCDDEGYEWQVDGPPLPLDEVVAKIKNCKHIIP